MTETMFNVGDVITLVTAAGVIVALIGNIANLRSKRRESNPAIIEMRQDIKYIRSAIDKQEGVNGEQDKRIEATASRVAVVEQSVRSAHKRIDDVITARGGAK